MFLRWRAESLTGHRGGQSDHYRGHIHSGSIIIPHIETFGIFFHSVQGALVKIETGNTDSTRFPAARIVKFNFRNIMETSFGNVPYNSTYFALPHIIGKPGFGLCHKGGRFICVFHSLVLYCYISCTTNTAEKKFSQAHLPEKGEPIKRSTDGLRSVSGNPDLLAPEVGKLFPGEKRRRTLYRRDGTPVEPHGGIMASGDGAENKNRQIGSERSDFLQSPLVGKIVPIERKGETTRQPHQREKREQGLGMPEPTL